MSKDQLKWLFSPGKIGKMEVKTVFVLLVMQ